MKTAAIPAKRMDNLDSYPKLDNENRLRLINQIAFEFCKSNNQWANDGWWLIGMLSDTTMTEERLAKQIEITKEKFPEYAHLFDLIS